MKSCGTVVRPSARSIISARRPGCCQQVDLGEGDALVLEQPLGPPAVGAERRGVDLDLGHVLGSGILGSARRLRDWASDHMGCDASRTTRARVSTSTWAAPARRSTRAQAPTVAPVVSTSSTSSTVAPSSRLAMPGMGAERAGGDVREPRLAAEALLRGASRGGAARGRAPARSAGLAGERLREDGRLVVAALEQAPAMQRHRRDQIGVGQQLGAGARQPATERRRGVGAVGVLEGQDQAARAVVVAQRRARPIVGRRLGGAGAAERRLRQRVRQRIAAQAALRRPEKGQRAPAARRTAGPGASTTGAAAEAARRQHQVERTVQHSLADGAIFRAPFFNYR